jgi:hypothetical protein
MHEYDIIADWYAETEIGKPVSRVEISHARRIL